MDALLRRLCTHVSGLNEYDQRLEGQFQLAVHLLNYSGHDPKLEDHNAVADKIRRKLVHDKRVDDAVRFSGLVNKLLKSVVVKNSGSILTLFLALNNNNAAAPRPRIGGGKGKVNNVHQEEDTFPLPKLHCHSEPHGAATATTRGNNWQKDCTPTKVEGSSSVWPLAERYKTAATAQPNSPFAELQHIHKTSSMVQRTAATDRLPLKHITVQKHHRTKAERATAVEVTEKDLIREILFTFQGLEGDVIKVDTEKDGYRINPAIRVSQPQKDTILKLTEVGWLYKRVRDGTRGIGERTSERVVSGLVHQSLILALKEYLNEHCRLIAVLESQIQEGGDTPLGEASGGLTLKKLFMWTFEPRFRLETLAFLADSARHEHGGACISELYKHLHHGNPSHKEVVSQILSKASQPIYEMMTQWLLEGNLEDPHFEFFIASNPLVSNDKLWQDKYSIRWSMLPSFISKALAQKILASGKSLNFLRCVCHFRAPIAGRDVIKAALQQTTVEALFLQDDNTKLEDLISLIYRETSRHVLEEILTRHKFLDHLRALRRYLLLGQGDFVHYLMEVLSPELTKSAANLYPHNLSSLLETAKAASNAQYEEPDILQRLDVRLVAASAGDIGWDVFCVDYHVDGPIGTVFTEACMNKYLTLFNTLWKQKRMELILSSIWKEQAATSKLCRDLPEFNGVLHGVQLLTMEMIHLVHQLEYYMTFEVLECSWDSLMNKLKSAKSLDNIICAHNEFLERIFAGALLDESTKDLRIHLRTFYNLIENLKCLQDKLSETVLSEVNARKTYEADVKARTEAGDFGTSAEVQNSERKKRETFVSKVVINFKSDLNVSSQTYKNMVKHFLLMLTQHDDQNLHMLSTRLDFNSYYHQHNQRLTYHHKRKSMGASFTQ